MVRVQSRFHYFASPCHTRTGGSPLLQTLMDTSEIKMSTDQVRVQRTKGRFHQSDRLQQESLSLYPLPVQSRQEGKIPENKAASQLSVPAVTGKIECLMEKSSGVFTITLLLTRYGEGIEKVGQCRRAWAVNLDRLPQGVAAKKLRLSRAPPCFQI